MPMQKTTTPLPKTDLKETKKSPFEVNDMQPSENSINKILQFAATYRAQKISKNQYVDMFLN